MKGIRETTRLFLARSMNFDRNLEILVKVTRVLINPFSELNKVVAFPSPFFYHVYQVCINPSLLSPPTALKTIRRFHSSTPQRIFNFSFNFSPLRIPLISPRTSKHQNSVSKFSLHLVLGSVWEKRCGADMRTVGGGAARIRGD